MTTIHLTYETLEPILVTRPGGDPNTDESLNYLPGGAVRGALAGRYLAGGGTPGDDFTRLFLGGRTRFGHAYLLDDGRPTWPTPAAWRAAKDGDGHIYDLRREQPAQDKRLKPFYCLGPAADPRPVLFPEPRTTVTVHTTRDRRAGRATRSSGDVYRYLALAPGQQFAGTITTAGDADADTLRALLRGGDLLLGGAITAGYGRVRVTLNDAPDDRSAADNSAEIPAGQPITLYFAADAILRHPATGQTGGYVVEALNARLPGHAFSYHPVKPQFGRLQWVGGFNRKWGLPLPQTWAVAAGSVYTMQSDAPLTIDDQTALAAGLGERLAEGLGVVVLNPDWDGLTNLVVAKETNAATDTAEETESATAPPPPPVFPALTGDERALLARMNRRLAEEQLDRLVLVAAQRLAGQHGGQPLSKSQYGRLTLRLRGEMGQYDTKFAALQIYLRGVEERKTARDQFRKSRVAGHPLLDWLETFVGRQRHIVHDDRRDDRGRPVIQEVTDPWTPKAVWVELNLGENGWKEVDDQWQRPLLGAAPYRLDNEAAHRYTIRLLMAVFDLLAKRARK